MTGNVIHLFPAANVAEGLRNIADGVDEGQFTGKACTVILGGKIFHLGCVDDAQAAGDAIFNMTLGLQILMRPIVDAVMDGEQLQ